VRIKEYTTLTAPDLESLDDVVNSYLSIGWHLYGPPRETICITPEGSALWAEFRQTMVFPVGPDIRDAVTIKEM